VEISTLSLLNFNQGRACLTQSCIYTSIELTFLKRYQQFLTASAAGYKILYEIGSKSLSVMLRSESPSSKREKLHTVAASNNRTHTPCSLYYCLFVSIWLLFFAHIPFVVHHEFNPATAIQLGGRLERTNPPFSWFLYTVSV